MARLQKHVSSAKIDPKLGVSKAPKKAPPADAVTWFETECVVTEEKKSCYRVDMATDAQQLAVGTSFWPLKKLFPNGHAEIGDKVKIRIGIVH